MVVKSNDKIVYGSWKDGSDIYKEKKGYYTIQWNPKTEMSYKKYLPTSWKPKKIKGNKSKGNKSKENKSKKNIKKQKPKTHKSFWNIFNF